MLLGEFREKTKDLDNSTVLVMYAENQKDGIEIPINTLDFDPNHVPNKGSLLTLTDGEHGSYSL